MRKEKRIQAGGKEVVVKELTLRGLRALKDTIKKFQDGVDWDILFEAAESNISIFTNLKALEEIDDATVSELIAIKEAFKEVNSSFLEIFSVEPTKPKAEKPAQ